MQNIGLPSLILIAVVVLVLFGKGKVSALMGEVGKGITAFKRGVKDEGAEAAAAAAAALEAARDVTPAPTDAAPAATVAAATVAAAAAATTTEQDKV